MSDLSEIYYQYFDVLTDQVPEVMDESFKLRYQVYCIEHKYEDAILYPDGREIDRYDARSVHGIVQHKRTGLTAATVRLVLPDPMEPAAPFPIEQNAATSMASAASLLKGIPHHSIAEISRFAVSREFRRRLGEADTASGVGPDPDRYVMPDPMRKRVIPHLILGLFTAIVKMSAEQGVTHWYAIMDISLLRLLNRFGINFTPIGAQVDYHGLRQPCIGDIDTVLAGIWKKRHDVWQLITDDGVIWPAPVTDVHEACTHA